MWALEFDLNMTWGQLNGSEQDVPVYTPGVKPTTGTIVTVIITVWIVVANITFISAILSAKELRRRKWVWLLVNLSASDLCVGLLVTPFSAYYENREIWDLGHKICLLWLIMDVYFSTVSLFALFMINVDRVLFVLRPVRHAKRTANWMIMLMCLLAWVVAVAIVFPLFFHGQSTEETFDVGLSDMCYVELSSEYSIGTSVATYFVPGFLVICLNITIVAIVVAKTRRHDVVMATDNYGNYNIQAQRPSKATINKMRQTALSMCVVNTFYLLMWLPFFLFNTLLGAGKYDVVSPRAITIAIWVAYSNSGLNPILWLFCADIRWAVWRALFCRSCKEQRNKYNNGFTDDYPLEQTTAFT